MEDASHGALSVRELLADGFGFNFNPIGDDTGVLAAVSAFCKAGVVARMQKIRSFAFTKGLYSTPGGLLLERKGEKVDIDWHEVHTQTTKDTLALPWAFFYSDVQYEIQLVKPGHRVIITYDIYGPMAIQEPHTHAMSVTGTELYRVLDSFVKNLQLLPKGGVLAFGLANAYPAYVQESERRFNHDYQRDKPRDKRVCDSDGIISMLQGGDVILYRVLTELRMKPRLKAVYIESGYDLEKIANNDNDDHGDDIYHSHDRGPKPHGSLLDDFTCFEKSAAEDGHVLLTADTFSGIDENTRANHGGDEDEGPVELLIAELGAKIGWDIIWVKTPKIFHRTNSFLNYGAFVDHNSVSAAFVVDIPHVVEGRREGF
ncbi:hypothetical protein FRB98_004709 [Tulasnella sp. 332]|nr:hypothetical protein FRB98_004709 [Tulasnella sp. 332]